MEFGGHDAKALLKYYEMLDVRERVEELTALPFGKTKKQDIKFEVFSN